MGFIHDDFRASAGGEHPFVLVSNSPEELSQLTQSQSLFASQAQALEQPQQQDQENYGWSHPHSEETESQWNSYGWAQQNFAPRDNQREEEEHLSQRTRQQLQAHPQGAQEQQHQYAQSQSNSQLFQSRSEAFSPALPPRPPEVRDEEQQQQKYQLAEDSIPCDDEVVILSQHEPTMEDPPEDDPNPQEVPHGVEEVDDDNNDDSDDVESVLEQLLSPQDVIRRIEALTQTIVQALADQQLPEMTPLNTYNNNNSNNPHRRRFVFHNMTQCRTFSNILLVLSFCHTLLLSNRTTTTREVYYFYVTHFRSQKECDAAIVEAANLLRVPRSTLGLFASPKGWFCGCIQLLRKGRVVLDGQALSSIQGAPITQEWMQHRQEREFTIECQATEHDSRSNNDDDVEAGDDSSVDDTHNSSQPSTSSSNRRAKCILVIEKEGVYNRFSQDRLYDQYPCILVTGKGFPDVATRSFVYTLHQEFQLPVYGVTDCNPYGILVLYTYQHGSERLGMEGGSRYSVPIQWLGLRPSQVAELSRADDDDSVTRNPTLPPGVYQQLTDLDRKKLVQLLDEDHPFHGCGINQGRYEELELMEENGYKVELESLNWLGMDFMVRWVYGILTRQDEQRERDAQVDEFEDNDSSHMDGEVDSSDEQSNVASRSLENGQGNRWRRVIV